MAVAYAWRTIPRTSLFRRVEAHGMTLRGLSLPVAQLSGSATRFSVPSVARHRADPEGTDWLEWEMSDFTESPGDLECLPSFITLADAPISEYVRFARLWGPLGHLWTVYLGRERDIDDPDAAVPDGWRRAVDILGNDVYEEITEPSDAGDEPLRKTKEGLPALKWERLDDWRNAVRHMLAILRVAIRLDDEQAGTVEDWHAISRVPPNTLDITPNNEVRLERWREAWRVNRERQSRALGDVLDAWLATGSVRVSARPSPERSSLQLGFTFNRQRGLTGLLAVQLASALTSPFGLYECDACRLPYNPENRRPRFDKRRYCPACSGGASLAAKRDYARRRREQERKRGPRGRRDI